MTIRTLNTLLIFPVLSPGQRDTVKFIAFMAMLADHTNTLFGLHNGWLMLFGRVAFPLFALVWGMNQAHNVSMRQSSLNKLWLWAIIAQPAYGFMVMQNGSSFYQLNILFTFAVAAQVLKLLRSENVKGWLLSIGLVLLYLPFSMTSYFIAGLALLWFCVWMFRKNMALSYFTILFALGIVLALNVHVGALFAFSGLILSAGIVIAVSAVNTEHRYLPKGFFLDGYVLHLLLLVIIRYAIVFNG